MCTEHEHNTCFWSIAICLSFTSSHWSKHSWIPTTYIPHWEVIIRADNNVIHKTCETNSHNKAEVEIHCPEECLWYGYQFLKQPRNNWRRMGSKDKVSTSRCTPCTMHLHHIFCLLCRFFLGLQDDTPWIMSTVMLYTYIHVHVVHVCICASFVQLDVGRNLLIHRLTWQLVLDLSVLLVCQGVHFLSLLVYMYNVHVCTCTCQSVL